jgi:hypothetical protein
MGQRFERFGLSGKPGMIWRWPNDDRCRMSASCRRKACPGPDPGPASRGRGAAALDCGITPPAAVRARGTSAPGRDETALCLHSGEQSIGSACAPAVFQRAANEDHGRKRRRHRMPCLMGREGGRHNETGPRERAAPRACRNDGVRRRRCWPISDTRGETTGRDDSGRNKIDCGRRRGHVGRRHTDFQAFLANAGVAGIVLGARGPIILTSRADSVEARLASCAVAALVAQARREQAAKALA